MLPACTAVPTVGLRFTARDVVLLVLTPHALSVCNADEAEF